MHLYLDIKYLNLISNSLPLFKKKSEFLWNCRCTICGDSSVNKQKARGFFFKKDQSLFYRCHNCGASMSFFSYLKNSNTSLYQKYCLEKFRDNQPVKVDKTPIIPPKYVPKVKTTRLIDTLMDRLDTLPKDNPAVKYAVGRNIPEDKFSGLYYVDNIKNLEQLSDKYKDKIVGKEPRLVFPFFDWTGQLIGVSARALGDEKLRYITVKIRDDELLIYGTDSVDLKKRVYVVEGPIDSLFIDNCIAVAGTAFTKMNEVNIPKENMTLILDNQPRNKEVLAIYNKMISNGYSIVIWPENIPGKDINELVNAGYTKEQVRELIDRNTYSGLTATINFNRWKKI